MEVANTPKKDFIFEENQIDSGESSDNYENSDPVPEAFLHTSHQGLYETDVDPSKDSVKKSQLKTQADVSKISEDVVNESYKTDKS